MRFYWSLPDRLPDRKERHGHGQFASVKNDINAGRSPYVGFSGGSLGTAGETTTGMQVGLKVGF